MSKNKNTFLIVILFFSLIIGFVALYFGTVGEYRQNLKIKGYTKTQGTFTGIIPINDNAYKLMYTYVVNGETYTVSTESSTDVVPQTGSTDTVYYDPHNPSDAIVFEARSYISLIAFALVLVLVPLAILIPLLFESKIRTQNINQYKKQTLICGLILLVLGITFYSLLSMEIMTLSLTKNFQAYGIGIFVPFITIALGIYTIKDALFVKPLK